MSPSKYKPQKMPYLLIKQRVLCLKHPDNDIKFDLKIPESLNSKGTAANST